MLFDGPKRLDHCIEQPAFRGKLCGQGLFLQALFPGSHEPGESILVVDDVEEQRVIATGMLKELGYSVTWVASGEEAVEYVKIHPVDLIVLDMIMDPGMDGLETYRKIIQFRPGQKCIIASGFSESYRIRKAQRLGAGAYVKKPYLSNKIGPAVRAELNR